jgi:acetoin utilization deacetylase AcuC-like enzyme
MLPFRLVYHERYDLHFGDHVFPSKKFKWLHDRMLWTRFAVKEDFVTPAPAADEDLLLAHDRAWIEKLSNGTLSYQEILQLEVPYSRHLVEGFWLAAGGSMLAARLALDDGIGYNLGGGFHHACPDHGEGFCAINDIATAPRPSSPAMLRCLRSRFTSTTTTPPINRPPASTLTWTMAWPMTNT